MRRNINLPASALYVVNLWIAGKFLMLMSYGTGLHNIIHLLDWKFTELMESRRA